PRRDAEDSVQQLVGTVCTSIKDAQEYIGGVAPGIFIKHFLVDIDPEIHTSRQRRKAGHRTVIKLVAFEDLESHLRDLDDPAFQPITYTTKEYIPRGTILTNGFLLQLLCFKRRELLSVKYKRLPNDRVPSRLTTTLHGTDDYLTEIRNIIGSKEDVAPG
ncbi:hypothetical protein BGZ76_008142, partial [Entomortierella beljakovae]